MYKLSAKLKRKRRYLNNLVQQEAERVANKKLIQQEAIVARAELAKQLSAKAPTRSDCLMPKPIRGSISPPKPSFSLRLYKEAYIIRRLKAGLKLANLGETLSETIVALEWLTDAKLEAYYILAKAEFAPTLYAIVWAQVKQLVGEILVKRKSQARMPSYRLCIKQTNCDNIGSHSSARARAPPR